jgi:hypothetical protein
MKKNFYKNINLNNKKSSQHKVKGFIPKAPLSERKPVFFPGDVVGFRNFYDKREAVILYHRRDKIGAIEYVVKFENKFFGDSQPQVFKRYDLYLKPLTRKVLFEKAPRFRRLKVNKLMDFNPSGTSLDSYYLWEILKEDGLVK